MGVTSSSMTDRGRGRVDSLSPRQRSDVKVVLSFLTSSAAEDLHTQVEGVSELHGDDAQVASSDQTIEPAGDGRPAHHPHLEHLHGKTRRHSHMQLDSPDVQH